ncbi:MAG: glycosyltransferase family 39 protein [Chitinophagaceae bacterium]
MQPHFLPGRTYSFLFILLGLAYLPALFVPLMDNDSAHHANIALHMYLTGDYVNLVDHKGDYLDKPHLLFWLCAFSYKIFGVTSFAYKLPSLLFTLLGTYSTYRLGWILYNKETGKLAALVLASALAYMLANNDVRMDAILTASVAFGTWQLAAFIHTKKWVHVAGAALGLALAFSTKGMIGVLVPLAGAFFYVLYRKEWALFFNPKWLILAIGFGLFIFPVVYCYYVQFNLHPEKIVRGRDHIDGVRFILWGQSFERFEGESFGGHGRRDPLFFVHTFIWAYCPWCMLALISLVAGTKTLIARRQEWLTAGVFITVMLGISLSGFKLPHYLNIVFPAASILVASFLVNRLAGSGSRWIKPVFNLQLAITVLLSACMLFLNTWAFPIRNAWVVFFILSLVLLFYLFISSGFSMLQKTVLVPAAAMIICFFLLNINFYLQLLHYQGGSELAFRTKEKINPQDVYLWKGLYTPSWNFYTATDRRVFEDTVYRSGRTIWLLTDQAGLEEIQQAGYQLGDVYTNPDYGITRLKLSFVNPLTRKKACTEMVLAAIRGKHTGPDPAGLSAATH